jgi:hypothetical protein
MTAALTPSAFSRSVNIRKRLAPCMEEDQSDGLADGLFRPIRVLCAQGSRLQLPGGVIQTFSRTQFLCRRHDLQHLFQFGVHRGNNCNSFAAGRWRLNSWVTCSLQTVGNLRRR